MLASRALPAAGLLTFAAYLLPATAGDPSPPATPARLPLTRVTLFTAGVGYFHREGTVDGTARVDVRVPEEDVNDLIKTLVATDKGGTPRAVTYDAKAPAEVTLKAFQIDLTENPSVADLLGQVRGEKVEITDKQGVVTAGTIVSVDKPEVEVIDFRKSVPVPEAAEGATLESTQHMTHTLPNRSLRVNLLTDASVESVPLETAKKVRFVKPELQAEFRKALEALAAARGAATKTVGVTFAGAGKRPVSLGYVTEAPLWKPTYRVSLDDAGAKVEGWVAVENTTDEDWENVKLSLMSGRPMTFQMNLYDPLFVPRPTVEPELYASLRPPVYQGSQSLGAANFLGGFGGGGFGGGIGGGQLGGQIGMLGGQPANQLGQPAANLGVGGGVFGTAGGQPGPVAGQPPRPAPATGLTRPSIRGLAGNRLGYDEFRDRLTNAVPTVDSAPQETLNVRGPGGAPADFGQSFRYDIAGPVSLPRFKSALLPVVSETAGVERVSIYNAAVLDGHPLLGLRLTNKSKQFLAQGPVAVFDGGSYAGDARLPDVRPGETRLLSYAVDLDVHIDERSGGGLITRTTTGIRIEPENFEPNGQARRTAGLAISEVIRDETAYTVENRSATPRTVLITRPIDEGARLVSPAEPAEKTADLNRFEVKVGPNKSAELSVIVERTTRVVHAVDKMDVGQIESHLRRPKLPASVKAALTRVLADREKLAATEKALTDEDAALKTIVDDQTRLRANIERVPRESQAYQRYLKKFDDQETEIEKRQARVKELRADLEKQKKAIDGYLKELTAE